MLSRLLAWWSRNAALIGPIATAISALAAMASVLLTRRTYRQSKKDRQEEVESKHPRFIVDGTLVLADDINDYYTLDLKFSNIAEHSARFVRVNGKVTHNDAYKPTLTFERRPLEQIHADYPFEMFEALHKLSASAEPYFLRIELEYKDDRTNKSYKDIFERKFWIPTDSKGLPASLPIWQLDFPERKQMIDARHKKLDKDWQQVISDFQKLMSGQPVDNSSGQD